MSIRFFIPYYKILERMRVYEIKKTGLNSLGYSIGRFMLVYTRFQQSSCLVGKDQ